MARRLLSYIIPILCNPPAGDTGAKASEARFPRAPWGRSPSRNPFLYRRIFQSERIRSATLHRVSSETPHSERRQETTSR